MSNLSNCADCPSGNVDSSDKAVIDYVVDIEEQNADNSSKPEIER